MNSAALQPRHLDHVSDGKFRNLIMPFMPIGGWPTTSMAWQQRKELSKYGIVSPQPLDSVLLIMCERNGIMGVERIDPSGNFVARSRGEALHPPPAASGFVADGIALRGSPRLQVVVPGTDRGPDLLMFRAETPSGRSVWFVKLNDEFVALRDHAGKPITTAGMPDDNDKAVQARLIAAADAILAKATMTKAPSPPTPQGLPDALNVWSCFRGPDGRVCMPPVMPIR